MSDQLSQDLRSLQIDRDAPAPPSAARRFVLWGGLAAAALVVAVVVVAPRVSAALFRTEVGLTEVAVISPSSGFTVVTGTGYVQSLNRSLVGAKIPGRVARVLVREGEKVEAGQPLIELEAADQRSAVAAARARVAAAQARAEAARANAAEIETQLARAKVLAQNGATAKSVVDDLEARARSLEQMVTAADAEIAAAQAEASALSLSLGYLTLTAPITGTVVTRPPEVGQNLSDAPAVELADMERLVAEIDVPEGRLGLIKVGGPAEIVLDAFPSERRRGEVIEIGSKVNRAKATVLVKVKFLDDVERVLPEMSARVSFLDKLPDPATLKEPPKLVVPKSALVERGGATMVFVVDGDTVRMTPVTLGPALGEGFELKMGPPAGTKLVREPPKELADGHKIKERARS